MKDLKAKYNISDNVVETADAAEGARDLLKVKEEMDKYRVDPSEFYAHSRDMKRIDVGLIIARPPIFLHMHPMDRKMQLLRHKVMKEYDFDWGKYDNQIKDLTHMQESKFYNNPYVLETTVDALPSHKKTDNKGNEQRYAFASKNWRTIDPTMNDPHCLQNAAANFVYLLFKNRHSEEWEFPTTSIPFGKTMLESRIKFFDSFAERWLATHVGTNPVVSSKRDFTIAEKEDEANFGLTGVRTYYFQTFHKKGLPGFRFEGSNWLDYAWVPKGEMNKYLTKDKYEVMIDFLEEQ